MIKITKKGSFSNTEKFLARSVSITKIRNIEDIANDCLKNLKNATPKDTGRTADSWTYVINRSKENVTVEFLNKNIQNGVNIAILLDVGHATITGSWIEGKDYIDPAIQKSYLDAVDNAWRKLKKI